MGAWLRYWTAARFALTEQARNRTALLLLLLFVPAWDYLCRLVIPDASLDFLFRATNTPIRVGALRLSLLTAGLYAITLITGFMIFASTRRNIPFDHRLSLCGYPRPLLLAAKLTALIAVALIVSLYTTLILLAFWHPASIPLVWLGFFCSALGYGAFGLMTGVLVRGELEGFFLIIMISLIDTSLQNPLGNPMANEAFIRWFPSYAPMQFVVAGAFNHEIPWLYLPYSLIWPVAFVLVGFSLYLRRTRIRHGRPLPASLGH